MTHEEAIEWLGKAKGNAEALRMAKEALEKQIPKKAIKHKELGWEKACPNCERILIGILDYCEYCGQRIDWSEKI